MLVDTPARFRMNRASLLAVFTLALCLTTLTAASPWFLLVLLVLYSVLVGFSGLGWLMLVGGIAAGALGGVVLAYAPRRARGAAQIAGLVGVVAVCTIVVVLRLALVW